ncbi:hypothetical protein AVEN_184378-1 [Araneus ventricosus]|uniref:Uncharacterized protein n=1 Tax=Araneus ventricosus TaxID=182803 RepID=A0A4Y2BG09_ARAVE|nr:hypothetical protein AVEN_184378-1 [Araneus ventricosus]
MTPELAPSPDFHTKPAGGHLSHEVRFNMQQPTYTANLQRNQASNLEPSGLEAETLPLSHRAFLFHLILAKEKEDHRFESRFHRSPLYMWAKPDVVGQMMLVSRWSGIFDNGLLSPGASSTTIKGSKL